MGVLGAHGLTGRRLCLEITETARLTDSAAGRAVCTELRGLGVRLSLDDFGAGQSTLSRLRDLPIDEVKIDRAFVELEALTRLGCHRAQGFLFSRPVPGTAVDRLVGSSRNWLLDAPGAMSEPESGRVRRRSRDAGSPLLPADTAGGPASR